MVNQSRKFASDRYRDARHTVPSGNGVLRAARVVVDSGVTRPKCLACSPLQPVQDPTVGRQDPWFLTTHPKSAPRTTSWRHRNDPEHFPACTSSSRAFPRTARHIASMRAGRRSLDTRAASCDHRPP